MRLAAELDDERPANDAAVETGAYGGVRCVYKEKKQWCIAYF
jgi:hypothetical protein